MEQDAFDTLVERMSQPRWLISPVENPERTKRKWFVTELTEKHGVSRHGSHAEWEEDDLLRLIDEIRQYVEARPLVATVEASAQRSTTEQKCLVERGPDVPRKVTDDGS